MRKRRSARERERLFNLHNGRCHICSMPIHPGEAFELEHVVPYELTRDESDGNVMPAHRSCHKRKSAIDIQSIRKADRMRQKHLGLWPRSTRKIPSRPFPKRRMAQEAR